MQLDQIFLTQFVLTLLVVALLANWFARPWLARMTDHGALLVLAIPHAFRHIGLVFLAPGVVSPDMPERFTAAAGYGDFAAGLIAIAALIALRGKWAIAIPLVWLLTIVGLADLANALRQVEVIPYMQAAWYIPTFLVPVLLVTHGMTLGRLVARLVARLRGAQQSA